jgi:mono/diheme cytochrome c family protein
LSFCAAVLGFGRPVLAADDKLIAKGHAILEQKCARCHAIGPTGESTHPQAPPFRAVVKRYPVEDLAESLAEGIVSGHPDMPVFTFQPAEINAILAYLGSLSRPEGGR